MPEFRIERATRVHSPDLLFLIQELADYEALPNGPQLDAKTLGDDLEREAVFGLVAYAYDCCSTSTNGEERMNDVVRNAPETARNEKGVLAGMTLYCYPCYSWKGEALHMEDIYIRPDYRRSGLGFTLVKKLLQLIHEENLVGMSWDVLSDNQIGLDFYNKIGGINVTDTKNGGYWMYQLRENRFHHVLEMSKNYSWRDKFTLKEATPEDAAEIYRLTQGVARVEGRPEALEITVEQIADYFRRKIIVGLLLYSKCEEAETGGANELAGICVYRYQYSTWRGQFIWLDDLYIEEKFRRHGLGLLFMVELVQRAKASGIQRLGWTMVDSNHSAETFYKKLQAVNMAKEEGWLCYRLYRSQMAQILDKNIDAPLACRKNANIYL